MIIKRPRYCLFPPSQPISVVGYPTAIVMIIPLPSYYCAQLLSGWHKLWQAGKRLARTDRICEDQEVSQAVLSRSEAFLSTQSSVLSPQTKKSANTAFLLQKCQKN